MRYTSLRLGSKITTIALLYECNMHFRRRAEDIILYVLLCRRARNVRKHLRANWFVKLTRKITNYKYR